MKSLKTLHTFGFNSTAADYLELKTSQEVAKLLNISSPYYILGGGSNTAFVDDFDGTIIKVSIKAFEVEYNEDHFLVTLGAGEDWHQALTKLIQLNIYGLENLALIPGTVGGAVVQNIGAYGVEIADYFDSVECVDLQSMKNVELPAPACNFGYRQSIFKQQSGRYLITKVKLKLPVAHNVHTEYGPLQKLKSPSATDVFHQVISIRQAKLPDPNVVGNAGSFFKNCIISRKHYQRLLADWPSMPSYKLDNEQVKVPTAWLLEQLGYKGRAMNGIASYHKQPLVLVNTGDGNGQGLIDFAQSICAEVKTIFAINLENEVTLIGRNGEVEL